MTSQAVTTVEAYLDAFGARDTERILSPFAADATWTHFTVTDGLITDYRVFEDSLGITRAHLGEPLTAAPA